MVVVTVATLVAGAATAATNETAKTTTTLTTNLSLQVLEKVVNGRGDQRLRNKIKAVIQQRMLVPDDDLEPFKRGDYASTPILASMRTFPRTLGVVYVAYVPPSKGKSMACYAFLKKYAHGKAIAFSPPDGELTYIDKMLSQLQLYSNAGTGLVNALVDELHDAQAENPSYIILDDFMPDGPNLHDVRLLMHLKSRLREKNVYCIVLTSNVDSANYSLTRNKLASIQPLVSDASYQEILSSVKVDEIKEDFTIEWETHCNMMWEDDVMKETILLRPEYAKMSPEKKNTIESAIDDYLQSSDMTDATRYDLTIYGVLSRIQRNVNIPPTPANRTATTPRPPDPDRYCWFLSSPFAPKQPAFS